MRGGGGGRGGRGESVSDSIRLATWVPGIFITEAGVFYCFRFHFSEHVGERNISVSWSLKNQGRGSWLLSFSSSDHVGARNISVSWYLNHGAGLVGCYRSILRNTWAIGTFPFPGILIIGAGVFYCFRFHSIEHVGERNIFVSWPYKHKEREELPVSWVKETLPFTVVRNTRTWKRWGSFSVNLNTWVWVGTSQFFRRVLLF
jgi:hypothetical protein